PQQISANMMMHYPAPFTPTPSTRNLMHELSPSLRSSLQMQQPSSIQQHGNSAVMEDDAADPPSPPAVSSDDMDIEASSLSDDSDRQSVAQAAEAVAAPRQDAQTQCDITSGNEYDKYASSSSAEANVHGAAHESFVASLTSADMGLNTAIRQQESAGEGGYRRHRNVEEVSSLVFDERAMEC
ncbi:hypothetical protein BGZ54_003371, partial [Gamsiella multidivaricata]